MGDFAKLNADLLRGPMAVAAGENEGTDGAVVVWDLDGVDRHWGVAYWAVETVPLTSIRQLSDLYRTSILWRRCAHLPVALCSELTSRDFEEAARTIPTNNLFDGASWTSDLLAILTVHQVIQGIQRVARTRRRGIKCPLLFLAICFAFEVFIDGYRDIGAGATDVSIWERHLIHEIFADNKGSQRA